jgi:hypothetical protein
MSRAALGRARRSIIKRQKQTGVVKGALSTLATVTAFGAGQVKKAETAWGEYEAGYEALGGEGFEKPKFGQGYFKGPEGEVNIGKGRFQKTYDMEQVRKAGSFLGSDASAVLSDNARSEYLQRTAPGKSIKRKDYPTSYQQEPSVPEEHIGGVDPLGEKRMRVSRPDSYFSGDQPAVPEEYIGSGGGAGLPTDEYKYQTARRQEAQLLAPRLARQRADKAAFDIGAGQFPSLPDDMSGINIASRHQQYLERLGAGQRGYEEHGTYERSLWDSKDENNKRLNKGSYGY